MGSGLTRNDEIVFKAGIVLIKGINGTIYMSRHCESRYNREKQSVLSVIMSCLTI